MIEGMVFADEIAQTVRQAALDAGFDLAGIAPVQESDLPELSAFVEWVDAGRAGEMKYLETRTEAGDLRRSSAKNAAPWVRSMVVCALNYSADKPYSTEVSNPERGWISRYAWGSKDYHDALLPRLKQVEAAIQQTAGQRGVTIETRSYVDTGPILERVYARHAGIGWIGKNTCIINQKLGSWLFLGVVLTSLDLAPDLPAPDRCGSCTRCIDACPTQAIVAPGKLDARLCIAYLTIEKRGTIPEELRSSIGHHVFGCDICQDVCPWNNKAGNAPPTSLPEFQPQPAFYHPDLRCLAQMDEEAYRRTFRGSPVKRAKYSGLKRNVAVAMGNSGNQGFVEDLKRLAADPDPVVAEHAAWALKKLAPG
jgi:epoxyqueuosine reductase